MVGSWTLLEEASQLRSEALTTGTLPFHTGDLPLGSPKPSAHPFLPLPWHVAWGWEVRSWLPPGGDCGLLCGSV